MSIITVSTNGNSRTNTYGPMELHAINMTVTIISFINQKSLDIIFNIWYDEDDNDALHFQLIINNKMFHAAVMKSIFGEDVYK